MMPLTGKYSNTLRESIIFYHEAHEDNEENLQYLHALHGKNINIYY
jgi:hypothetical protein